MAVNVSTPNPAGLLAGIYKAIDDKKVRTWRYIDHDGGRYLTHCADQWDAKAWFRPAVIAGALVMNILPPQNQNVSSEVYAIYHGRFIEMILAHFDSQCTSAGATAMPTAGDQVKAA